jgi:transcriptional regulator with XRE-family HTH domain
MTEPTLGVWLRRERERRGITIKTIADQTKVAAPLLEGLESGDVSRWPGGIYRRAFVRAYATALGLDADEVVQRFEQEHPSEEAQAAAAAAALLAGPDPVAHASGPRHARTNSASITDKLTTTRARLIGTAADLTVALVLGLGSAAAGSRLLWPVLLIAAYYAIGVLLTGTSPMVALLSEPAPSAPPVAAAGDSPETAETAAMAPRPAPATAERRHQGRRPNARQQVRAARTPRARLQ